MAQTVYDTTPPVAFAGMKADGQYGNSISRILEDADPIPFGVMLVEGSDGTFAAVPSAAGEEYIGIAQHFHYHNLTLDDPYGVDTEEVLPIMREGVIWVRVEESVDIGDPVYFRHTVTGVEQAGDFRMSADGVAQVTTITPSAANTTIYSINVVVDGILHGFQTTSDGSGDATEICDAFRVLMAADTVFDALVDSTGTATLILTAVDEGTAFQVSCAGSNGTMTVVETAASAPDCDLVPNARWVGPDIESIDSQKIAPLCLVLL